MANLNSAWIAGNQSVRHKQRSAWMEYSKSPEITCQFTKTENLCEVAFNDQHNHTEQYEILQQVAREMFIFFIVL